MASGRTSRKGLYGATVKQTNEKLTPSRYAINVDCWGCYMSLIEPWEHEPLKCPHWFVRQPEGAVG